MPNKYSHGFVLSQQQYRGIIDNNPYRPLSLKPSSSCKSASHPRSTVSSTHSPSNHSTQSSANSRYLRLEPDSEAEPPYDYRTSTHTDRPSSESTPSHAPQVELTSSERSPPSSERLRLESPGGFRIETSPSPPWKPGTTLSDPSHYHLTLSQCPDSEPSPPERLRLGTPFPVRLANPRPSLHHKSSSLETQIYAPKATTSPPPTQGRQTLPSIEPRESYRSPPPTDERQHEFSMESPESYPPPIPTGDRPQRFSSETQRAYLPSPTRDRGKTFVQETQALASPQPVRGRQARSPFGTPDAPLFPSDREIRDYFSIQTPGSQPTPAMTGDRQALSSTKACSASPTPSQDGPVRPSVKIHRLKSPPQTQDNQRRPYLGTRYFSSERRPETSPFHGRRQSIDSPTTHDSQHPPSSGPGRLSLDQPVKPTEISRRQSTNSQTAQQRRRRPSLGSQKLSLEQFIQESERIREPSIDSQIHSPQLSSSYTGKSNSRQTTLANAQRYTPKSVSLEHSPQSRRDQPAKLPDQCVSQQRSLLPTAQGAYDNVMIETHGFPPERPPSPPATPDSSRSFSLTRQTEEPQRTRLTPPIPQRSAKRSPPRQHSMSRSTNSPDARYPSEPTRPKTSSAIDPPTNSSKAAALHAPTLSISTRRSSINATISPQSMSFSDFSETVKSPRRQSFSQSSEKEYFEDTDLESLPSEIDFNVLPFEDPNSGPAIFRTTQLGLEHPVSPRYEDLNAGPAFSRGTQLGQDRPVLSRASSFDSAAPPPIGLNRRISHATAERNQAKMPKKESKMSLLSFLRSTPAPKAVLYSEATQGKPPFSVSVSRTPLPSIPKLFPGYRGQFPPPQKMQDKDSQKSEFKLGTKAGSDPRRSAPRSAAHTDAAEKRKSWFKGDQVDKKQAAARREKKKEFERILNKI